MRLLEGGRHGRGGRESGEKKGASDAHLHTCDWKTTGKLGNKKQTKKEHKWESQLSPGDTSKEKGVSFAGRKLQIRASVVLKQFRTGIREGGVVTSILSNPGGLQKG